MRSNCWNLNTILGYVRDADEPSHIFFNNDRHQTRPTSSATHVSETGNDGHQLSTSHPRNNTSERAKRRSNLGSFEEIYEQLGNPIDIPTPTIPRPAHSSEDEDSHTDSVSTAASSPPDDNVGYLRKSIVTKEVRWQDEVDSIVLKRKGLKGGKEAKRSKRQSRLELESAFLLQEAIPDTDDQQTSTTPLRRSARLAAQSSILKGQSNTRKSAAEKPHPGESGTLSNTVGESYNGRKKDILKPSSPQRKPAQLVAVPTTPVQDELEWRPQSLTEAKYMTPAWVTPPPTPRKLYTLPSPTSCIRSNEIEPLQWMTRDQKKRRLLELIAAQFALTASSLLRTNPTLAINQWGGNHSASGIHVFVDSSNISIGFHDFIKRIRGLQPKAYTRRIPMSFHSLALIMERGRGVAKRVVLGSCDGDEALPDYMRQAVKCGYEVCALKRVEKYKEVVPAHRRRRSGYGNGYATSGQSSGSDTPFPSGMVKKFTEQGVDEILHMKMLESICDHAERPGTMVLATGDAAEAEYSGGFMKNVERALSKGWKVELVAWGHSMSALYRRPEFLEKWGDRFQVFGLEAFGEELLQVYAPAQ